MKNIDSASGWEKYEMVERFKANIPILFFILLMPLDERENARNLTDIPYLIIPKHR